MGQEVAPGEEPPAPRRRGLSPIEFLESYSAHHPETVEALLEWPCRRVIAAYEAWQRRKVIEEWEERKRSHIAAIHANPNYDKHDKKYEFISEIEQMYDRMKDEASMTEEDRRQIDAESDNDFMRAGRRAMARAVERSQPDMPGIDSIRRLPEDPGEPWA